MKRTCLKHVPPARAQHLSNHIVLLFKRWQRTCSLILIIPARERSPGCAEGDEGVPGDCSHRVETTENPILRHVALIALPYCKVPPDWNEAYNQACSKKTLRLIPSSAETRIWAQRHDLCQRNSVTWTPISSQISQEWDASGAVYSREMIPFAGCYPKCSAKAHLCHYETSCFRILRSPVTSHHHPLFKSNLVSSTVCPFCRRETPLFLFGHASLLAMLGFPTPLS